METKATPTKEKPVMPWDALVTVEYGLLARGDSFVARAAMHSSKEEYEDAVDALYEVLRGYTVGAGIAATARLLCWLVSTHVLRDWSG